MDTYILPVGLLDGVEFAFKIDAGLPLFFNQSVNVGEM